MDLMLQEAHPAPEVSQPPVSHLSEQLRAIIEAVNATHLAPRDREEPQGFPEGDLSTLSSDIMSNLMKDESRPLDPRPITPPPVAERPAIKHSPTFTDENTIGSRDATDEMTVEPRQEAQGRQVSPVRGLEGIQVPTGSAPAPQTLPAVCGPDLTTPPISCPTSEPIIQGATGQAGYSLSPPRDRLQNSASRLQQRGRGRGRIRVQLMTVQEDSGVTSRFTTQAAQLPQGQPPFNPYLHGQVPGQPLPTYGQLPDFYSAQQVPGNFPAQLSPEMPGPDGVYLTRGYPSGGYSNGYDLASGHPVSGHHIGGYPVGGHPIGDYPVGGYPAGGYPTGGYTNGGHFNGYHPTGGYDTGPYPTTNGEYTVNIARFHAPGAPVPPTGDLATQGALTTRGAPATEETTWPNNDPSGQYGHQGMQHPGPRKRKRVPDNQS